MRIHPIITAIIALIAANLHADDWPQWRGPNRDGISNESGLLKEWPEGGPELAWTAHGAGVGYSSPSIANGRLFLTGDRDQQQFVICFNAKTVEELWATPIGRHWHDTMDYHGARCTPTVDGNRIYALGTSGDLVVLRATDGKLGWSINILEKFNAKKHQVGDQRIAFDRRQPVNRDARRRESNFGCTEQDDQRDDLDEPQSQSRQT